MLRWIVCLCSLALWRFCAPLSILPSQNCGKLEASRNSFFGARYTNFQLLEITKHTTSLSIIQVTFGCLDCFSTYFKLFVHPWIHPLRKPRARISNIRWGNSSPFPLPTNPSLILHCAYPSPKIKKAKNFKGSFDQNFEFLNYWEDV